MSIPLTGLGPGGGPDEAAGQHAGGGEQREGAAHCGARGRGGHRRLDVLSGNGSSQDVSVLLNTSPVSGP